MLEDQLPFYNLDKENQEVLPYIFNLDYQVFSRLERVHASDLSHSGLLRLTRPAHLGHSTSSTRIRESKVHYFVCETENCSMKRSQMEWQETFRRAPVTPTINL